MPRILSIAIAVVVTQLAACGGGEGGGVTEPRTGSISGRVTSGGTGVPNAQVSLAGVGNQTTNSNGQFAFSNVATGTHTVTLTVPSGLELDPGQQASKPVTVTANFNTSVEWTLRPASGTPVDTVRLSGVSFDPAELSIPKGRTVVWINVSGSHTVTPRNHSEWQDPGATSGTNREVLRHTFNNAGTFNYVCIPHEASGMVGRITVQ